MVLPYEKVEVMAETGPGKNELRWHAQCIRAVGGLTAEWALVHQPSLAARLVHALTKLLSVQSDDDRREPEAKSNSNSKAPQPQWGFLGVGVFMGSSESRNARARASVDHSRLESSSEDDRSEVGCMGSSSSGGGVGDVLKGARERRERLLEERKKLADLKQGALEVRWFSEIALSCIEPKCLFSYVCVSREFLDKMEMPSPLFCFYLWMSFHRAAVAFMNPPRRVPCVISISPSVFYFAVCCTRCPCHCLHAWVVSHRL